MLFYATILALFCLPPLISIKSNKVANFYIATLFCILGLILIFKGNVGTDTAAYIALIEKVKIMQSANDALSITDFEPGFIILLFSMTRAIQSSYTTLNIIAIAVTAIFATVLYKLPKSGQYAFSALLFTHFLLPYTFNTVRIGLSIALATLGFLYYTEHKIFRSLFLVTLSLSIQITSVFFFILLFLIKTKIKVKNFILAAAAGIAAFYFYFELITTKLALYSDFEKPSLLSGASTLAIQAIIVVYCKASGVSQAIRAQLKLLLIAMLLYALGKNIYSFLRLLDLALFASILHASIYSQGDASKNMKIALSLIIVFGSIVSSALFLKNIADESPDSDSKWIPYHTTQEL